jgi:hypothetical protein
MYKCLPQQTPLPLRRKTGASTKSPIRHLVTPVKANLLRRLPLLLAAALVTACKFPHPPPVPGPIQPPSPPNTRQ